MDFLRCNNINSVGNVQINYIWPNSLTGILCEVFKPNGNIKEFNKKDMNFTTGIINDKFYQQPITFKYITISEIKTNINNNNIVCSTTFSIKNNKNEILSINHFSWNTRYNIEYFIKDITKLINTLNLYIDKYNNNNINWCKLYNISTQLYPDNQTEEFLYQRINELVNNISVKSYSDSLSRVGKDNYFWNETFISNLPKNFYEKHLLYEALKKYFPNINKISYQNNENEIFIKSDAEYYYGPSETREEITGLFPENLYLILKMDLARKYKFEIRKDFILKELCLSDTSF